MFVKKNVGKPLSHNVHVYMHNQGGPYYLHVDVSPISYVCHFSRHHLFFFLTFRHVLFCVNVHTARKSLEVFECSLLKVNCLHKVLLCLSKFIFDNDTLA